MKKCHNIATTAYTDCYVTNCKLSKQLRIMNSSCTWLHHHWLSCLIVFVFFDLAHGCFSAQEYPLMPMCHLCMLTFPFLCFSCSTSPPLAAHELPRHWEIMGTSIKDEPLHFSDAQPPPPFSHLWRWKHCTWHLGKTVCIVEQRKAKQECFKEWGSAAYTSQACLSGRWRVGAIYLFFVPVSFIPWTHYCHTKPAAGLCHLGPCYGQRLLWCASRLNAWAPLVSACPSPGWKYLGW